MFSSGHTTLPAITPHDKLFTVDLAEVAQNLQSFPWVESVRVRREFPGTIQIQVTEREPYLYLALGDTIYIADKAGHVFKKKEEDENYNLPVITGFTNTQVGEYPEMARKNLKDVIAFYQQIGTGEFYQNAGLSQIHFDPADGMTVFTAHHDLEIFYGRDDTSEKQKMLDQIADQSQKWAGAFARLDLNSQNRIIARKKHYEQKK